MPSVMWRVGTARVPMASARNSAASRGLRGKRMMRRKTLLVPAGMIPRAALVPITALATSWTTPSPPMATTTSKPSAAAAADSVRAWAGPLGQMAVTWNPRSRISTTSRWSDAVKPDAAGLATRRSRRIRGAYRRAWVMHGVALSIEVGSG